MKQVFTFFLSIGFSFALFGQNTVGLQQYDPEKSFPGYNLFFSHNQSTVFLIDNCGRVVHTWEDSTIYRPGNSVYLMENGDLLKCKRLFNSTVSNPIWAGGGGETVEMRDWNNELLWSFSLNNDSLRLHHDVAPMPNGNVLMIVWELVSEADAIQAGRDPAKLDQNKLWPDYILEYDPMQDAIVWEWHVMDHLIQDFDESKDNFGSVEDHPELVDINFDTHDGHPDWMHANAIDYEPTLDQIMISVPYFHEIWVIDHSTTTEEAAGHSGGNAGKGGDLLYRWGNPLAYRKGTAEDQSLFFQHDAQWVDKSGSSSQNFGKIAVFNNRVGEDYSTANIIASAFDINSQSYSLENGMYGPLDFERVVKHPEDSTLFYSNSLSGTQLLPNGNMLMLAGRWGNALEVTADNELVWEYTIPLRGGQPVEQGEELAINNNITFRLNRYALDYPAFEGKDLSPGDYIELNPAVGFCEALLSVEEETENRVRIYPNPAKDHVFIDLDFQGLKDLRVINSFGQEMFQQKDIHAKTSIPTAAWAPGLYFIQVGNLSKKLLVIE